MYPNSTIGYVAIYVAGPGGAIPKAATWRWPYRPRSRKPTSTPLCITPVVSNANNVSVNVTYTIWVYNSVNQNTTQIEAAILSALEKLFSNRPIGGDIIEPAGGYLYQSLIQATIENVFPNQTFRVTVSAPSGDTALGLGDVPVLGTVTPTINFVSDPQ